MNTDTHILLHTHVYTIPGRHTNTHMYSCTLTNILTQAHADTHSFTHLDTHTSHIHMDTDTPTHRHTLIHTHTHGNTHAQSHSQTLTPTHTLVLALRCQWPQALLSRRWSSRSGQQAAPELGHQQAGGVQRARRTRAVCLSPPPSLSGSPDTAQDTQ